MIKLNGHVVELNQFPDGTLLTKEKITEPVNIISWRYENDRELFAIYCLARHINDVGMISELYMPYIPNARQDRVKEDHDVFTLKYFSEIINACGFRKVYVFDPHSPVSEALINNICINTGAEMITELLEKITNQDPSKELVVCYPDDGAYKKYSSFVSAHTCYGIKKRDWATGKISGLDIMLNGEDIKGKTILMVDDIISYGGSMFYAAKKLKELGCGDIYIYASHVENSILDGELIKSGLFKKIFTTDSLFSKSHKTIEVVKIIQED